jgi:hypothetical protein
MNNAHILILELRVKALYPAASSCHGKAEESI